MTLYICFSSTKRVQQYRITDQSVKDPGSSGRKTACSLVAAKGNISDSMSETTRKLGFSAFILGSDTISCGGKAVPGSVFGVPSVKMVVL